jgi:protocatechuate 3,4-dioxygenase beta subunit
MIQEEKMKPALLFILCALWLTLPGNTVMAQSAAGSEPKGNGTLSGRITIGDQPIQNVEVILAVSQQNQMMIVMNGMSNEGKPPATATTDADGRYRFTGLAAGNYRVSAYAPAYVSDRSGRDSGKLINVSENETVENVDFSLTRGGVITGKVTDADGKPVIGERVQFTRLDAQGRPVRSQMPNFTRDETDDRGIYRLFGIAPGRYIISAGASPDDPMVRMGGAGGYYKRTFYPDTTDEAQARPLEISAGSENENIDIRIARSTKGYAAIGRVVDADTGAPIPGVMIGYGIVKDRAGESSSSISFGGSATNSQGEFRIEGLVPNTYEAFANSLQSNGYYSERTRFQIMESDVSNIEIRMRRGAVISGVAVIEGAADPAIRASLSQVIVMAQPVGERRLTSFGGDNGKVSPGGTFTINGVMSGKVQLIVPPFATPKGLTLVRVERNGVEVPTIDVAAGEQISDVRLVFAAGNGSIVGRVQIAGGQLPPDARINVRIQLESAASNPMSSKFAEVDSKMQFLAEGLAPGTYKVSLTVMISGEEPGAIKSLPLPRTEQMVTITGAGRHEVTLIANLAPKKEGEK